MQNSEGDGPKNHYIGQSLVYKPQGPQHLKDEVSPIYKSLGLTVNFLLDWNVVNKEYILGRHWSQQVYGKSVWGCLFYFMQ